MRTALTLVLAGLFLVSASFLGAALLVAAEAPAKPASKPATDTAKPDANKPDAAKPAAAKPGDAKTDAKTDAKKDPAAAPAATDPYEKKVVEIEKCLADAKAITDKITAMEGKVNEQVAKMVDGAGKPVSPKTLRADLMKKSAAPNPTTYRNLTIELIKQYQLALAPLNKGMIAAQSLTTLTAVDDATKKRGNIAAGRVKQQMIMALTRMAGLCNRIADFDTEMACHKQILTFDPNNPSAQKSLKDAENQKTGKKK